MQSSNRDCFAPAAFPFFIWGRNEAILFRGVDVPDIWTDDSFGAG